MRIILYRWWQNTQSSFWFVPSIIVMASVALAAGMIAIDVNISASFEEEWPLLFGAGAEGSRGVLSAIASSMITVAGVVFSMTIVALALTSSQYSSRVLHTFMRDRINQGALGIFLGIFAYCLTVLRTIRSGDEVTFVPSLAVLVGLLLAFFGIVVLIHFIHHISISIQASSIISAVARETISVVDRLLPEAAGAIAVTQAGADLQAGFRESTLHSVLAVKTGYVETIDEEALVALARDLGTIVRMERGIGEFVIENTALASVTIRPGPDTALEAKLNSACVIGSRRSIEDDVGFGIRQLVDIAMKALSPGINDTTTAVMCVEYLTAILVRIATRHFPASCRFDEGQLRVISRVPDFESLLNEAFDEIRENAEGNTAMLKALFKSLGEISPVTAIPDRRSVLRRQVKLIAGLAERTITEPDDLELLKSSAIHVMSRM